MTRGFVTLTTGDIKYYKMAVNMLASFRLHNPESKFAIVCDRENEYTAKFDDVIVLENANGDYRDKFSLLVKSPYDENIFIEPDCLIYRNLDFFWDLLSKESDFSSFGWNSGGIDCWFKTEEIKNRLFELIPELPKDAVVPLFNPGYIFIRRGEKSNKMYNDCLQIAERIKSDKFFSAYDSILCNGKLRDDPIFNLGMAINGFICHDKNKNGKCIFVPSKYTINKIDIINGKLDVTDKNGKEFNDCSLLHFSTRRVMEEGLYPWQCAIMNMYIKYGKVYKVLDNALIKGVFELYRWFRTRAKEFLKF